MAQAIPAFGLLISAASAANQHQAQNQQQRANKRQALAQDRATGEASAARREAAQREIAEERRSRPNLAALLATSEQDELGGLGSSFLTGPGGVDRSRLRLGRTTLLGE